MAALNRPTNATYEAHENVTIDTQDNEDHTFCGIMFPIKCKELLPVEFVKIESVAVRGRLGPLTVWVSKKEASCNLSGRNRSPSSRSNRDSLGRHHQSRGEGDLSSTEYQIPLKPSSWTKVYDKKHSSCPRGRYTDLIFDEPVVLRPGEVRALYIHSTLAGDQAIVYDNSYGSSGKRFEDDKICIFTGRAHISTTCFGKDPIWGWGNAWRDRREFVGRLAYGTVYKLWNPEVQPRFGSHFQNGARALFLCQRRWESPLSSLPDEAIFYILNMCRWDWFDDCVATMRDRRKREKARNKLCMKLQQEERADDKPSTKGPCENQTSPGVGLAKAGKTTGLSMSDSEEEDHLDMSDDDYETSGEGDDEDITMNSDDVEFGAESSDAESSEEDDDHYHTANRRYFSFQCSDSDDEEGDTTERSRSSSIRNDRFRYFARIHVLQALAAMEDHAINQF